MSWVTRLQPDLILGRPVVSLTPDLLQQYHLKGLVLDVDDTLVPLKAAEASEELVEWVKQIRQVATLWLVSNNLSENRISGIARSLNLPYYQRCQAVAAQAAAGCRRDEPSCRTSGDGRRSLIYRCFSRQPARYVYDSRRADG